MDKALAKLRRNPRNVRFADLRKVCEQYFGEPRQSGSHLFYKTPWQGEPLVNIQAIRGVDGQRKCPAKWPAKMSLVLLAMITDGSYSTRSRFMGGLRASMYFFAVSRWMSSSRATPRVDNPLRFAF